MPTYYIRILGLPIGSIGSRRHIATVSVEAPDRPAACRACLELPEVRALYATHEHIGPSEGDMVRG